MENPGIINISGVDCYEKGGVAYLKLETVARGLGFTTTQTINGTEYTNIRWNRVDGYLEELGFATSGKRPDFIPENVFYRLAMKAKNAVAEAFQAKIADEVIPSIRKHGAYITPDTLERMIASPDFAIRLFTELKTEQDRRKALEAKIEKDKPKLEDWNKLFHTDSCVTFAEYAKILCDERGINIGRNRLIDYLKEKGVLDDNRIPYQKYMNYGYFVVKDKPRGSDRGYRCCDAYHGQRAACSVSEIWFGFG